MKKVLKYSAITLTAFIGLFYIIFLTAPFLVNSLVNFDQFKPDIQKIVKENSKLNLDYSKIRIYTTPLMSAGIILEGINVTLPDDTLLFKTDKLKTGIALPSLLTLTVKTSLTTVENPYINLEIKDKKQYKIISVVEDIINENNAKPKEEVPEELPIDIEKIKIKVPLIRIKNYEATVKDLKTNHYLVLKGQRLNLGYNGPKNRIRVNTLSELYSDTNKNIIADIKTILELPKASGVKEETKDPEEKIAIPFINIVDIYQKYDLKTNIKVRLAHLQTPKGDYITKGYLNVDDLSLKLENITLPNSYFHAKFKQNQTDYDSNIYTKADEKIALSGFFNYSKNPHLKTSIVSDKIHFSNLLDLLTALLDSLNINNNLDTIQAKGYLLANSVIDTDFKKIRSNGSITINNGSFISKQLGLGIRNLNANFLFDNNALTIKNTSASVDKAIVDVSGFIDTKSNVDIKANVKNLSIPFLYNIFAPKEVKKAYNLKSANLSANLSLKGKLEDVKTSLSAVLSNLTLSDFKNTMYLTNNNLKADFNLDKSKIIGKIENKGFSFDIPSLKTNTKVDSVALDMDNNSIILNPFDFIYNSLSKITINGSIKNYTEEPDIKLFLDGKIATSNLLETIGKDLAPYFSAKGNVPLKISLTGDSKKQDIKAQILSNGANHFTPINILNLKNATSIIQADIALKGGKIKFKDSGLYRTTGSFTNDLDNNLIGSSKLADLACVIDNNHINLLRLMISQNLTSQIAIFPKSTFQTKGKITLNGNFDDINFRGNLKVSNLNIPEILFKIKDTDLDFAGKNLNVNLKDIDINGSKVNSSLAINLKPAKILKISDINVNSDYINVDKALETATKATEILAKIAPAQNTSQSAVSQAQTVIPINAEGKFNISKLSTGAINANNIKGNIDLRKNILTIAKLSLKAFGGSVTGNVDMNLVTTLMGVKVKGSHINIDKFLTDAANMKNMISGTGSFSTDISLKGATYLEQMKSLKGNIHFNIKDGHYGPFAKLENFFLAENIRENVFFKNTIGAIISPITTIDSTKFESLEGKLNFKDGIASLESISSQGNILCILIKGSMDLINNEINSNVRVRLASSVSDALGPLALANPINLVKNTPGLNIATAKLFTIFTQVVDEKEYKEIPDFSALHSDKNATKFQIILKGDVAKPLKLVKSFKWLNIQSEFDAAKEFSDKYVKEQEELARQALLNKLQKEYEADNKLRVGVEKVLQMDTTAPKVKDILVNEIVKNSTTSSKEKEAQRAKVNEEIKAAAQKKKEEVETKAKEQIQQKIEEKTKKKRQSAKASETAPSPTANETFKSTLKEKFKEANKVNSPSKEETEIEAD